MGEVFKRFNKIGMDALNKGDFDQAISAFKQGFADADRTAQAVLYYNIGTAYYMAKNYALTIENMQKSVDLDPNDATAWYRLGLSFLYTKDFMKARDYYKKGIFTDKNRAELHKRWCSLGTILRELKDFQAEEDAYKQAFELKPFEKETLVNMANFYLDTKSFSKALWSAYLLRMIHKAEGADELVQKLEKVNVPFARVFDYGTKPVDDQKRLASIINSQIIMRTGSISVGAKDFSTTQSILFKYLRYFNNINGFGIDIETVGKDVWYSYSHDDVGSKRKPIEMFELIYANEPDYIELRNYTIHEKRTRIIKFTIKPDSNNSVILEHNLDAGYDIPVQVWLDGLRIFLHAGMRDLLGFTP